MGSMAQLLDPAGWWTLVSSGWNDIGHTEFWIALAKIMWINILLSGDNAVVIAMACRGLPHRQRVWGMILGAGVAVGLRVIFTGVVASLMLLPYLKIVGGLALTSRQSFSCRTIRTRARPKRPSAASPNET